MVQPGVAGVRLVVLAMFLVPATLVEFRGGGFAPAGLAAFVVDLSVGVLAVGVAVEGLAARAGLAAHGVQHVAVEARPLAVELVVRSALGIPGPVRFSRRRSFLDGPEALEGRWSSPCPFGAG